MCVCLCACMCVCVCACVCVCVNCNTYIYIYMCVCLFDLVIMIITFDSQFRQDKLSAVATNLFIGQFLGSIFFCIAIYISRAIC